MSGVRVKPASRLRIFGAGIVFVGAAMLTLDAFVSSGAVLMLLGGGLLWLSGQRAMTDRSHERIEVRWKARRRSKWPPTAGEAPKAEKTGDEVFPHALRAGDVVVDDQDDGWELIEQPAKSVRTHDYVVMVRRVGRPADIRQERWGAHERVKVRRA